MTTTKDLQRLAAMTTEVAMTELERRNKVTDDHARLVAAISRTIVDLAHGHISGRYAVTAPVGSGKSTLIRAAVKVLSEQTNGTALLVLQERIAEGREMPYPLVEAQVVGLPDDELRPFLKVEGLDKVRLHRELKVSLNHEKIMGLLAEATGLVPVISRGSTFLDYPCQDGSV